MTGKLRSLPLNLLKVCRLDANENGGILFWACRINMQGKPQKEDTLKLKG